MSTRLILLGTKGGPRPTPRFRGQPAQVLLIDGVPYVVDCGSGVADRLVLAGVSLPTLRHVFITHHHSDHVLDYGNLLLLAWAAGLRSRVDSWGPPPLVGMTRLAFALNEVDIEIRIADEGRPDPRPLVVPHEFSQPGPVMQDERVRVTAAVVPHGPVRPAFAYRFDAADRSVVISGDTAYSDAVIELARGADVLVHEAIYVPAIEKLLARNPNAATLRQHLLLGHTTPEDAGRVATAAGVKTLVLSHLVPGDDPEVTDEVWLAAHGISLIGVTNSWMSGRSAYFVEMIAKADLVAIHTASSSPTVAPHGGAGPVLGTNPIAFAIPGEGGPLVLDMGTSAFMATELQLRVRLGRELPEGVAVDPEGRPTRDAAEARAGALLPWGGHKGFGLGLIVQAFGLLGGAALVPGNDDGYVFIAFRPDLLVPLPELKRELAALIERVKAVPRQPGIAEIRIPGEQAARNRSRLARDGLDIDRLVYDRLQQLAG